MVSFQAGMKIVNDENRREGKAILKRKKGRKKERKKRARVLNKALLC